MNLQDKFTLPALNLSDRRSAQLHTLLQFLDVFAFGDADLRAGAARCGEKLRAEGYGGDEIIRMAATALSVAIEHEIDQRALVLHRLPVLWRDVPEDGR